MRILLFIFLCCINMNSFAQVLNLDGGVQIVAEKQVNVVLTESGIRNEGTFVPDSSTVFMDGGTYISLSGSQPMNFFNLRFRGSGTKRNEGTANVLNELGVESDAILDADGATNNTVFTLKSSKIATAFVDKIFSGDIVGNVNVERFINTGVATGEHGKSWQFLATPTSGQTIYEAWQEGGSTPTGFGTRISGNGLGFDVYSAAPALKFYNPVSNGWTAITNTFDPLQKAQGYMLFVRGDRSVIAFNDPANNTNMRSRGSLFRPNSPPASMPVGVNQFQSFGNPYASRIDFPALQSISPGIYDVYYAWDPMLNGNYGLGGYQTLSGIAGYIPTAGDETAYYPAAVPAPNVESGQAVLVYAGAGGGTVNFNENIKTGGSRLVHRSPINADSLGSSKSLLISRLLTGTGQIADGNILVFQEGLGNEVNIRDAPKLINGGENFGLMRESNFLAVEGRDPVTVTDTLFYHSTRLKPQAYTLELYRINMPAGLTGYLIDKHLHTSTAVLLQDTTRITLTMADDPGSLASDRFMIVFETRPATPFEFLAVTARAETDGSNMVWFKVNHERAVLNYTLEKSINGIRFQDAVSISSTRHFAGAEHSVRDLHPHRGVTYYRIRANFDSSVVYSNIVKVIRKNEPRLIAYPNPAARDENIHVSLDNLPKGEYELSILNASSQVIHRQMINYRDNKTVYTIRKFKAEPGTFFIRLVNSGNVDLSTKLLIR